MVERIVVGSLHTNSYVYFTGKKECFVIDPGSDAALIIKRLSTLNMVPRAIVFTHGHLDHTSAAKEILSHYQSHNQDVHVALHQADAKYVGKRAAQANRASFAPFGIEGEALFAQYFKGTAEPDLVLADGDTILGTDLTVIHTPGHTPGSVCLYSPSRGVLFSGDTLFFEGVGRSDLTGGNEQVLIENIRSRLYVLPPETRVFPGHGPQTTIERELHHNPFTRLN